MLKKKIKQSQYFVKKQKHDILIILYKVRTSDRTNVLLKHLLKIVFIEVFVTYNFNSVRIQYDLSYVYYTSELPLLLFQLTVNIFYYLSHYTIYLQRIIFRREIERNISLYFCFYTYFSIKTNELKLLSISNNLQFILIYSCIIYSCVQEIFLGKLRHNKLMHNNK